VILSSLCAIIPVNAADGWSGARPADSEGTYGPRVSHAPTGRVSEDQRGGPRPHSPSAGTGQEQRPNFILIIADDQDYERFGFMGDPQAVTPAIDQLASEGAVFPVAYTAPRCRPALATLLSGRYPHQTGIYFNELLGHQVTLETRNALPGLLRAAGYRTGAFGKWWEGPKQAMGFSDAPANTAHLIRRGQAAALDFLRSVASSGEPFFMWYAPPLPHKPHNPPRRLLRTVSPREIPLPSYIGPRVARRYQDAERRLLATVNWLDEGIDELVAELKTHPVVARNTMILFLVDNGWALGLVSKGSPFEKGVRTPLIVGLPDRIKHSVFADVLVDSVDIYATIVDYAGIPIPHDASGRSLRAILEGRPVKWRDTLFGAAYPSVARVAGHAGAEAFALYARTARWKYIAFIRDVRRPRGIDRLRKHHALTRFPTRGQGVEQLFDLNLDPYERQDLSAEPEHKHVVEELRRKTLEWWSDSGGSPLPVE
jgi:arylsulfatase A-like enzyme